MSSYTDHWTQLYQSSQQIDLQDQQVENMQKNHDLSKSVVVDSANSDWLPSPAKGVKRLILEREGGEKTTRATSIVAYAPNSKFAPHQHPLGEEFYVLSGTFSDEHGDYPAGTYVRNPPMSSHQPFSDEGCMIWVKLQQFNTDDRHDIAIDTTTKEADFQTELLSRYVLFDDYETVEKVDVNAAADLPDTWFGKGTEFLILSGGISDERQTYATGYWVRIAASQTKNLHAQANTSFIVKYRHLT